MLELFLIGKNALANPNVYPLSGPGSQVMRMGNLSAGYFGELSAAELFTASQIAAFSKFNTGVDTEANPVWLKFAYKGKFLFVAKKPVRTGVSWDDLYSSGVVYGSDTVGSAGSPQTTNQFTLATKGVHNLKIRLLSGDAIDPSNLANNANDAILSRNAEWNQLIYRVSAGLSSQYGEAWANYTAAELGLTVSASLCIERHASGAGAVLARGASTVDKVSALQSTALASWRPVLELVNLDLLVLSPVNGFAAPSTLKATGGASNLTADAMLRPDDALVLPFTLKFLSGVDSTGTDAIFRPDNALVLPFTLTSLSGVDSTGTDAMSRPDNALVLPFTLTAPGSHTSTFVF